MSYEGISSFDFPGVVQYLHGSRSSTAIAAPIFVVLALVK